MSSSSALFAVILLTFFLLGAGVQGCSGDAGEWTRRVYLGGPLLEVQAPGSRGPLPPGSVQVLVRFPDEARVLPATLRCELNGRDVTPQLTIGANGVAGSLFPLREGENALRLEVFGRGLWGDAFYQDAVEVRFQVRGIPSLDRARSDPRFPATRSGSLS